MICVVTIDIFCCYFFLHQWSRTVCFYLFVSWLVGW